VESRVNTSPNLAQSRTDKSRKVTSRLFIMPLLIVFCTLFYYFGELVEWAAWDALRMQFFYGIHDVHRLLFLVPIIYAGYMARVKGALIITLVTLGIFLPRAFFISPYPDPLLRMLLFVIFAGVIGCLVGIIRNQMVRRQRLEAEAATERDKLLGIVDGMSDGVVITGPDYKIRFMNSKMVNTFGAGTGLTCYRHLHNVEAPCQQECHIPDVINNAEVGKWECSLQGKTYEVVAAPYVDNDGTVCQISVFRDITQNK
jgi:PAS domain-containing protein